MKFGVVSTIKIVACIDPVYLPLFPNLE